MVRHLLLYCNYLVNWGSKIFISEEQKGGTETDGTCSSLKPTSVYASELENMAIKVLLLQETEDDLLTSIW